MEPRPPPPLLLMTPPPPPAAPAAAPTDPAQVGAQRTVLDATSEVAEGATVKADAVEGKMAAAEVRACHMPQKRPH